jgi:hypothetical protein
LLKFSFNTTTQKCEDTGNNPRTLMDCSSLSTKQLRSSSLTFLSLWSFKDAICGERFGNDDEVIEEEAANTIFKLVCKRRELMFFPPGARLLNMMEIT